MKLTAILNSLFPKFIIDYLTVSYYICYDKGQAMLYRLIIYLAIYLEFYEEINIIIKHAITLFKVRIVKYNKNINKHIFRWCMPVDKWTFIDVS